MPIGVPRIIYCWGEELPAQWTDIYNFIFRRRMVFLMQYLDDELCNQICGLLINIHMEDRSKELEKKEMENSGLFQNSKSGKGPDSGAGGNAFSASAMGGSAFGKNQKSIEDLMISEEDLGIDDNYMLERNTLQKISLEWLNWNAQFFDYSDEPYLYYLAELLSKDFQSNNGELFYDLKDGKNFNQIPASELPRLMMMFKNITNNDEKFRPEFFENGGNSKQAFEIYSAFRLLTSQVPSNKGNSFLSDEKRNSALNFQENMNKYVQQFQTLQKNHSNQESNVDHLISQLAEKDLMANLGSEKNLEKTLAQRQLRKAYKNPNYSSFRNQKAASYLNFEKESEAYMEYRDYYRKQTERTFQDEESKKVFMIINSFGGSVGNGITVHDALQFIKAGSMTLALGVAASAASLALAGGTIGERYVTEGCHVMIHQPEGGLSGQASDIWIDSQEIMKIRLDVAEIYSLSTYRPRHKILRDLDRDFYLTATETVYYGLADEIATNEVLSEIIEMTSKVWDYHESQQQRLLETRQGAANGLDTQTQS